jgi:hypothetical protein
VAERTRGRMWDAYRKAYPKAKPCVVMTRLIAAEPRLMR